MRLYRMCGAAAPYTSTAHVFSLFRINARKVTKTRTKRTRIGGKLSRKILSIAHGLETKTLDNDVHCMPYNYTEWVGESNVEYSGHSRVVGDDHHGGIVCGWHVLKRRCLFNQVVSVFLCLADVRMFAENTCAVLCQS